MTLLLKKSQGRTRPVRRRRHHPGVKAEPEVQDANNNVVYKGVLVQVDHSELEQDFPLKLLSNQLLKFFDFFHRVHLLFQLPGDGFNFSINSAFFFFQSPQLHRSVPKCFSLVAFWVFVRCNDGGHPGPVTLALVISLILDAGNSV